jgi:threonine/homoserine/homoserine lactone efflux protein
MAAAIALLLMAAFPLMGSPGPATLSLTAIGAAVGARRGLGYLGGIIIGTSGVLLLVASGVTGLILAVPALVWVVTALAAAYIVYLAYRIGTAPVLCKQDAGVRAPSIASGFILAIANPKAFAAIGAVYSSHIVAPWDPFLDAAVKILALVLVIVVVNAAWLTFGSAFSVVLRDPRRGRVANVVFAVLLVASVAVGLLS